MDHSRVQITTTSISCGVLELNGITDVEGAIYQIATRLFHPSRGDPAAILIGSDVAGEKTNTSTFFERIEELDFALVDYSTPIENPKTGNMIQVFVGSINHGKFKEWYSEQRILRLKKVGT